MRFFVILCHYTSRSFGTLGQADALADALFCTQSDTISRKSAMWRVDRWSDPETNECCRHYGQGIGVREKLHLRDSSTLAHLSVSHIVQPLDFWQRLLDECLVMIRAIEPGEILCFSAFQAGGDS